MPDMIYYRFGAYDLKLPHMVHYKACILLLPQVPLPGLENFHFSLPLQATYSGYSSPLYS